MPDVDADEDSTMERDLPRPVPAQALKQWLVRLETSFADRILPVDVAVADRWGQLDVPNPIPTVDGLLAATAPVHDLVPVTRNTRDVARTGARVPATVGRRWPRRAGGGPGPATTSTRSGWIGTATEAPRLPRGAGAGPTGPPT
jgi:hypothetical protein